MILNFSVSPGLPLLNVISPFVVPAFLGYLFAGPLSLRSWIAVKQAPLPEFKKSVKSWKTIALTLFIIAAIFGVEFSAFLFASESQLVTGMATLFALIYGRILIRFIGEISGVTQRSVHRLQSGVPIFVPVKQACTKKRVATRIGIAVVGAIITAGAFLIGDLLPIVVVSSSVIAVILSRFHAKNLSFRNLIFAWSGMIVATVSFGIVLSFTANKGPQSDEPKSLFTTLISKSAVGDAVDTLIKRYGWVYTSIYALIPGTLITISYRFDYQRYLDNTDTDNQFILATIPAPEPKSRYSKILGDGVIVPHRAPSSFPKVYYITSLVAFVLSQALLAVVIVYCDFIQLTNSMEYGALAIFVEVPIISFSLMAMATMRCEWKAFWSYRETWVVKAGDNINSKI